MYEPLAERMRPKSLNDYIGQKHLVGEGAVIRRMIESGNISSFILWGPPGVGKTTLARIIAEQTKVPFYTLRVFSLLGARSFLSTRFTASTSRSRTRYWELLSKAQ